MTLVKNKKFIKIFTGVKIPKSCFEIDSYDPDYYPYIGMGNPDSSVLFVGAEKGFDPEESPEICKHELNLNFIHWQDIVANNNHLRDHLHPQLKLRAHLKGFNPFSPLTLDETCKRVYPLGGHTYKQIEKAINASLFAFHSEPPKNIFQISPKFYQESVFRYCFITDLSDIPKKSSNQGKQFSYADFQKSGRYAHFMGRLGEFYRSFGTVVIYAGRVYTGRHCTAQRLDVLRLFNPKLTCNDLIDSQRGADGNWLFDVYQSLNGGAKVVVCKHITRGYSSSDLEHKLGVIGLGDVK